MQFAKISSLGLAGFLAGFFFLFDWSQRPAAVLASPAPAVASLSAKREVQQPAGGTQQSDSIDAAPRVPDEWLPSRGRECIRRGRYKGVCQGPRRVPRPIGAAAGLASELGLGGVRTVGRLINRPPLPTWQQAAGDRAKEAPLWPVTNGHLFRGLLPARDGQRQHKGLDIAAPEGDPIRAVKSGIVAYSDNAVPGYGNLLVVVHPDGSVAFYGHCRSIYVFAGERIVRGQVVGEVGQTGRATGPHVHFEYRTAGRIRNSLPLFGNQVPGRRRRA